FVTEALAASTEVVPPTVRDAVLARAASLPRRSRRVLDAVAVVPPRAELWLVEALCDGTNGLDDCLACGMLVEDGTGVAFRHELARIAVEESVPAAARRDLHRGALRALEAAGADVARLAHHAEAAGDGDAVVRFAPVAAERASVVGAQREAAAQ